MVADSLPALAVPSTLAVPGPDMLRTLTAGWLLARRSEHTRTAYRRDLAAWLAWLDGHGVEAVNATRGHVDAWAQTLTTGGAAPATIARRLSVVSSWYAYLVDEEAVRRNPAAKATRPNVSPDHSETEGLDAAQSRALLAAAVVDGARSGAIAHLALVVGLRAAEIRTAAIEDLGEQRGHRTLVVTRKGGARQRVALPPDTWHAVTLAAAGRRAGPIVATRTGRPMAASEIYRTVVRLARAAGITARITPHSLRHSCATLALDAGASLRDVQDLMGHKDPRTTRRYDRGRGALDRSPAYKVAASIAD